VTLSFLWQNPVSEEVQVIEKSFSSFEQQGADELEALMASMTFVKPVSASENTEDGGSPKEEKGDSKPVSTSFLSMLLFAFVGGLILNVMPCVLPVISLKLFGLVVHSDESRASILRHNIFYTLGVLSTFLVLSMSVLALKSTGENVGWGFQLQSPVFVSIMIAVLFVFALNLFGLYEFQTPGGKVLGDVQIKKGNAGDFFSGVLATVLSTPCSAPFLGTALTFAFTSSTLEILLIFQAIGVGLAFPFLMTGLFPATIKFLPKPGLWMESVKKFLGLTLLLTALWLIDVFISLTNGNLPLMKLNTGLLMLFFAFYFQKHISKKKAWRIVYFIVALIPFYMLYSAPLSAPVSANGNGGGDLIREKNASGKLLWEKWSEKKMAEYQQAGETVFLDFTAKWCFTCKVNEKLVLDTNGFKELIEEKNVKLLLGDWTKYDPVIGDFLKKNGFVGVPAYFIQKPDGTLIKLGETITLSKIREHL
jgi:thiol:disulfide interchange protein